MQMNDKTVSLWNCMLCCIFIWLLLHTVHGMDNATEWFPYKKCLFIVCSTWLKLITANRCSTRDDNHESDASISCPHYVFSPLASYPSTKLLPDLHARLINLSTFSFLHLFPDFSVSLTSTEAFSLVQEVFQLCSAFLTANALLRPRDETCSVGGR